jgi:protein TonB
MQIAMATGNADANARLPAGAQSITMIGGAPGVAGVATITAPGQPSPLRVGGPIASPRKIFDVPPILPEQALQAGIRGVVILEITIGTDGTVADAHVLRSIPLLDSAALECARQWRYEPVLLNGSPVPIVMTTPVSFP